MKQGFIIVLVVILLFASCTTCRHTPQVETLRITENKRFMVADSGDPFFWLGDTGWLLFTKLDRNEADIYFNDRREKGFNVIQVMLLHDVRKAVNIFGDSALVDHQVDQPLTAAGSYPADSLQYDYWDHVEYIVDLAADKGLYMALVPVWGSNVRNG